MLSKRNNIYPALQIFILHIAALRACGVVGYHARLALSLREGSGSIPDMSMEDMRDNCFSGRLEDGLRARQYFCKLRTAGIWRSLGPAARLMVAV